MTKTRKHKCPCCGRMTIDVPGDYEICGVCGWEDDPGQRKDRTLAGGANELCLDEARKQWRASASQAGK